MTETRKSGLREFLRLIFSKEANYRPPGVDAILAELTHRMIIVLAVVFPFIVASHLYRVYAIGWNYHFLMQVTILITAITLAILGDRVHYRVRAFIILILGVIGSAWGLATVGLLGSGILSLAIICAIAAILIGVRRGLAFTLLTSAIIAVVGALVVNGVVTNKSNAADLSVSAPGWILTLVAYTLLVSVTVICFGLVYNYLIELIKAQEARAAELERSKQSLEKAIAERERLEEQLTQSQKMEAIGRLAGGVAHDFNNQLLVILGISEVMAKKLGPDDPGMREIELIKKAGEKSAELTRQLLTFSRKQISEPRIISINDSVEDLVGMLQRTVGEDVELRLNLADEIGLIKIDPSQLDQVLMNLVVNARDAMPEGGFINIETGNEEVDEEYVKSHLAMTAGPYVTLTVSDTGCGMNRETIKRIFEPFFTTKEKDKGTGLGLATVYGIVKQAGGDVFVYSEPGTGATFKIFLPRQDAEVSPRLSGSSTISDEGGRGELIMVVEDDDEVREVLVAILTDHGYEVIEAADGAAALSEMDKLGGKLDLLITDVVMPRMNGRQLAEKMDSIQPGVKVLYVSGYDDDMITHHGMVEPGIEFLQKPFSRPTLLAKVKRVLSS